MKCVTMSWIHSYCSSRGLHKLICQSVVLILWTAFLTNDLEMSSVSIAFSVPVEQYLPIEARKIWSNNISQSDIVVFQYSTLKAVGINHWGQKCRIISLKNTTQTCEHYHHEGAGIRFNCSLFYISMDLFYITLLRFLKTQYNLLYYNFVVVILRLCGFNLNF